MTPGTYPRRRSSRAIPHRLAHLRRRPEAMMLGHQVTELRLLVRHHRAERDLRKLHRVPGARSPLFEDLHRSSGRKSARQRFRLGIRQTRTPLPARLLCVAAPLWAPTVRLPSGCATRLLSGAVRGGVVRCLLMALWAVLHGPVRSTPPAPGPPHLPDAAGLFAPHPANRLRHSCPGQGVPARRCPSDRATHVLLHRTDGLLLTSHPSSGSAANAWNATSPWR